MRNEQDSNQAHKHGLYPNFALPAEHFVEPNKANPSSTRALAACCRSKFCDGI